MPRLLGKAKISPKATAKLSLHTRSRVVFLTGGQQVRVKPTTDPLEAKREQALIQSTAAKIVLVRRKTEQLRDALVEGSSATSPAFPRLSERGRSPSHGSSHARAGPAAAADDRRE